MQFNFSPPSIYRMKKAPSGCFSPVFSVLPVYIKTFFPGNLWKKNGFSGNFGKYRAIFYKSRGTTLYTLFLPPDFCTFSSAATLVFQ
jgi:hypothetical protein